MGGAGSFLGARMVDAKMSNVQARYKAQRLKSEEVKVDGAADKPVVVFLHDFVAGATINWERQISAFTQNPCNFSVVLLVFLILSLISRNVASRATARTSVFFSWITSSNAPSSNHRSGVTRTAQRHAQALTAALGNGSPTLTTALGNHALGFLEETHGHTSPVAKTTAATNILSPSAVATIRSSFDPPRPPMDLYKPPRHLLKPLSPQNLGISVLVAKST
jgi:hypothetical protein